ncbi:SPOR domain-containing protein [Rheinheimera fenheensis]|uniref:SPOR domain-containing protein n=1 Tax=Rheinheimera fenheensis TaxID=3152295 RepID=UPI003260F45B
MTPAFKHRLLGTAILVMAGIIFLPDLLDGEKQVVKDDFKVIPNRPEFSGVQQQQVLDSAQFTQLEQQLAQQAVDENALDADNKSAAAGADSSNDAQLPSQQYAQVTVTPEQKPQVQKPAGQSAGAIQNQTALEQAAWVVRVGSFSKEQNANALMLKLRQAGFVTFTRQITNTQGLQLTSVLVGPELRKDKLEQQLPRLQQLTGIERLSVMSYQPAENN